MTARAPRAPRREARARRPDPALPRATDSEPPSRKRPIRDIFPRSDAQVAFVIHLAAGPQESRRRPSLEEIWPLRRRAWRTSRRWRHRWRPPRRLRWRRRPSRPAAFRFVDLDESSREPLKNRRLVGARGRGRQPVHGAGGRRAPDAGVAGRLQPAPRHRRVAARPAARRAAGAGHDERGRVAAGREQDGPLVRGGVRRGVRTTSGTNATTSVFIHPPRRHQLFLDLMNVHGRS